MGVEALEFPSGISGSILDLDVGLSPTRGEGCSLK